MTPLVFAAFRPNHQEECAKREEGPPAGRLGGRFCRWSWRQERNYRRVPRDESCGMHRIQIAEHERLQRRICVPEPQVRNDPSSDHLCLVDRRLIPQSLRPNNLGINRGQDQIGDVASSWILGGQSLTRTHWIIDRDDARGVARSGRRHELSRRGLQRGVVKLPRWRAPNGQRDQKHEAPAVFHRGSSTR